MTHELLRVVTSVADGAPLDLLAAAVAPIAFAPLTPDASTLAMAMTVSIATAGWESDAVTMIPLVGVAANARQISLVPDCPFARPTSVHVSPPPVTAVT